jgi:hypothetical protein
VRRGLSSLLAVAVLVAAGPAAARPRVAVLDLATDGMSGDVRGQFETLLEEGLQRAGYEVVDHGTVNKAVLGGELPEGCTFGPCVEPIARALRTDKLLNARVSVEGQSYSFVLSMLEARRGTPIAQVVGSCPVCTVAEALDQVGASIDVLESRSAAPPELVARTDAARRGSRGAGGWLLAAGVAAALGGAALVGWTNHDAPGWVTIGSGGTVALTGLIMLLGD